jgi:ferrous iron transport protein B
MIDVAESNGHHIDAAKLAAVLGVSVLPIVASTGRGMPELKREMRKKAARGKVDATNGSRCFYDLPPAFAEEIEQLSRQLKKTFPERRFSYRAKALLLLSDEKVLRNSNGFYPAPSKLSRQRENALRVEIDWRSVAIEARYAGSLR